MFTAIINTHCYSPWILCMPATTKKSRNCQQLYWTHL